MRMLKKNMDSMSAKQIRGALGLKKSATANLKVELQKLIRDGKIDKQGSRYLLAMEKDVAKEISIHLKGKRKNNKDQLISVQRPAKGRKSSFAITERGIFTRNQKGFGFVAIGRGRSDVFIGQKEQGFAMEGDIVEIQIYSKRGFREKRKGAVIKVLER